MPRRRAREALILAAGRGERMQGQGLPKPLVPFLGLPLLARTMRTLARAGFRRAVVAVGHEAERVAEAARRFAAEEGLAVEIVEAADWERGNGASALAARGRMGERFLMLMCDHVFEPAMLARLARAEPPAGGLLLAVDRQLDNPLVDAVDVTRVRLADDGAITDIGKGLEDCDGWDTGAFCCTPGLFDALAESDGTVTDAVRRMAAEGRARAFDAGDAFWADLDDAEAMRRAARAMLERAGGKSHDGPVARWLNRPLSQCITARLVERGATPTQVTWAAFALSLVAAGIIAAPGWWAVAVGGLLAQAASILDGCDGEIARLTMAESEAGGWLDAVLDRYADAALLAGFAAHAFWTNGAASAAMGGMAAMSGALINSYTADKYDGWMRRRGKAQRFRLGRDVRVFAMMVAALANAPLELLWGIAAVMHVENARRIALILRAQPA